MSSGAETADELVARWFLKKFRDEGLLWDDQDRVKHLKACKSTQVTKCEHGWECGCYSEYARDDGWMVSAHLVCDHGKTVYWGLREYRWGNLPEILKEVVTGDLNGFECAHGGVELP